MSQREEVTAVVLARGLGSRMQRDDVAAALTPEQQHAAGAGAKALMPLPDAAGRARPFLDWMLSGLADVGVTQVVLVVAPDHAPWTAYYEGEGRPSRVRLRYVVQAEPIGTADAVLAVESVVPARFLVMNGDNLYPAAALTALVSGEGTQCVAFDAATLIREGNIPVERLRAFARLDLDHDGILRGITEKPADADLARLDWPVSMNLWAFDATIFDACRQVPRSTRGEFELPQAVDRAGRAGAMQVRAIPIAAPVLDLSGRGDVAAVSAMLRALPVSP